MKCKKYKEWIILYLYGELDPAKKKRLDNHLARCPACRADLDETRRMFHLVAEAGPMEVPDADWDRCWDEIRRATPPVSEKRRMWLGAPRWLPAAAAAAVLVFGLGLFLGRSLRTGARAATAEIPALSPAGARLSLTSHFETLKPLLIDYANFDERENVSQIPADRALVRNLLIQNILLMRLLAEQDPGAADLLEDIELVLREIINQESGNLRAPLLIRDLIEERGVLFKMDVLQSF